MFKKKSYLAWYHPTTTNQSMQAHEEKREDCKAWCRLQTTLNELACSS